MGTPGVGAGGDAVEEEADGASIRHAWSEQVCALLERIDVGRAAQDWLNGKFGPIPRVSSAVFVLPGWQWAPPRIDVGRKGSDRDSGKALLMPVRLTWMPSPVVVVERGHTEKAAWMRSGLGHSGDGRSSLEALPNGGSPAGAARMSDPCDSMACSAVPRGSVKAELERLAQDGKAALWEAISSLGENIEYAVHRAHAAVREELGAGYDDLASSCCDEVTLSRICSEMQVGAHEADEPSFLLRLLDRCLEPRRLARVDLLRYITMALRSEAEVAIRRELGDPHIGRKVRALARERGIRDIDEVVEAYRSQYPSDRLARKRAEAALSVAPLPTACPIDIDEIVGLPSRDQLEDQVFDEIARGAARSDERRRSA